MQITFRQGGRPARARLSTRFGPVDLWIGQLCESLIEPDRTHTLNVVKYGYHLAQAGVTEPALRWEYDGQVADHEAAWSRYHLQGPIELKLGAMPGPILSEVHLPTGWVPLQEVLRFCIVDLGVEPLSRDWRATLDRPSGRSG